MEPFEKIVGKGENAGNKHFLYFPQCFLLFSEQISIFQSHLFCHLQMLSIWTCLKLWYVKGLSKIMDHYDSDNDFYLTERKTIWEKEKMLITWNCIVLPVFRPFFQVFKSIYP